MVPAQVYDVPGQVYMPLFLRDLARSVRAGNEMHPLGTFQRKCVVESTFTMLRHLALIQCSEAGPASASAASTRWATRLPPSEAPPWGCFPV